MAASEWPARARSRHRDRVGTTVTCPHIGTTVRIAVGRGSRSAAGPGRPGVVRGGMGCVSPAVRCWSMTGSMAIQKPTEPSSTRRYPRLPAASPAVTCRSVTSSATRSTGRCRRSPCPRGGVQPTTQNSSSTSAAEMTSQDALESARRSLSRSPTSRLETSTASGPHSWTEPPTFSWPPARSSPSQAPTLQNSTASKRY